MATMVNENPSISEAYRKKIMLIQWLVLSTGIKFAILYLFMGSGGSNEEALFLTVMCIPGFLVLDGLFLSFWKIRPNNIVTWAFIVIELSWFPTYVIIHYSLHH